METDGNVVKQILDGLYPQLEALETRCMAIQQFLKEQEIATDEQLAPYLEQAGKASNVKWLANRLRTEYLLSSFMKEADKSSPEPKEKLEKPPLEMAAPDTTEADGKKARQKTAGKSGAKEEAATKEEKKTAEADGRKVEMTAPDTAETDGKKAGQKTAGKSSAKEEAATREEKKTAEAAKPGKHREPDAA